MTHTFLHQLAGLGLRAGREASELESIDLLRALDSAVRLCLLVHGSSTDGLIHLVADRAWRQHVDLSEYPASDRAKDPSLSLEKREFWRDVILMHFDGIAQLLRHFAQVGMDEEFDSLDHRFRKVLEFWRVDANVLFARRVRADSVNEISEEQRAWAATVLAADELRSSVVKSRQQIRLSVLAWMLRPGGGDVRWPRAIRLAQTMPGMDSLVTVALEAADHDGVLSNWVSFDGPERVARSIDAGTPSYRALLFIAMVRGAEISRVPPHPDLRHAIDTIRRVADDDEWFEDAARNLGGDVKTLERVRVSLLAAVEAAVDEHHEADLQKTAESDLDDERVEKFRSQIHEGYVANPLLEDLLQFGNSAATPLASESGNLLDLVTMMPKSFFVPTTTGILLASGSDIGRNAAIMAGDAVVWHVVEAATGIRGKGDVIQRLHQLLHRLRDDGYEPSMLLKPHNWRLGRRLGLPDWLEDAPDGVIGSMLSGWIDGIPVLSSSLVPDDRLIAVDLASAVRVKQRVDGDGAPTAPHVEVRLPTDDEVEAAVNSDTDLTEDQRRRRAQAKVRVTVSQDVRIETINKAAARSVKLLPVHIAD